MAQRRFKPYLRDNYQKFIQQKKSQWTQPEHQVLPGGTFFPVSPALTDLFRSDNDTSKPHPGEKLVLSLPGVHFIWPDWAECTGTLQVTNYRLIFVSDPQQPANPNLYTTDPPVPQKSQKGSKTETLPVYRHIPEDIVVPLASIEKVEHDPKLKPLTNTTISPVMFIDIICKDIREYRFGMPKLAEGHKALALVSSYAFDTVPHHLYTFSIPKSSFYFGNGSNPARAVPEANTKAEFPFVPRPSSLTACLPEHLDGWRFYNPQVEYTRMGLPNDNFQISNINADYSVCPSYPNVLVIPQPAHLTEAEYRLGAKFRSKNRVPALIWKNPTGEQTIWRCSQPATGIAFNRSPEDEKLLEFIGKSNNYNQNLTIIDCRPITNAYANNIRGFGFETESNYPTAQLKFMNIENIHEIRKAYKRLRKACIGQRYDQYFPQEVHQSLWLKHIQDILKATTQVVNLIDVQGQSVLIRCSDGWDRTSQLTSLSKLCLDPYYRTIRGFTTLIDHEWLSFGHKFHDRYGHFSRDIKDERSPIFIQFLDCVHQLTVQFPRHFEFTSAFLVQIALHSYSSRFGTFLLNTEKERQFFQLKKDLPAQRIADLSISLWTYLFCCPAAVRGEFYNSFYSSSGQGAPMDLISPDHQSIIPPSFISADSAPLPGADLDGLKFIRSQPVEGALRTGSVIYPNYSSMKLGVWAEYFFTYHFDISNEFFHFNAPGTTGNLLPGGATISSLKPATGLYNAHFHWSQMLAGALSLRTLPQTSLVQQLQTLQATSDANLVQLVQLLSEKDAMLQWYQDKYGPIDESSRAEILSQSPPQQPPTIPNSTTPRHKASISSPGAPDHVTISQQEENAFYIEQQQQLLLHRASYCVDLRRLSTQLQSQVTPHVDYDPLTGMSFATNNIITEGEEEEEEDEQFVPQRFNSTNHFAHFKLQYGGGGGGGNSPNPPPQTSPIPLFTPTVPSRPKRPSPNQPIASHANPDDIDENPPPPPPPLDSDDSDDIAPMQNGFGLNRHSQNQMARQDTRDNYSEIQSSMQLDEYHVNRDDDDDDDDDNAVTIGCGRDDDDDAEMEEAIVTQKQHQMENLSQHLIKKQQQGQGYDIINDGKDGQDNTYSDDEDNYFNDEPSQTHSRQSTSSNQVPTATTPSMPSTSTASVNNFLGGFGSSDFSGPKTATKKGLFDLDDDEDDGAAQVEVSNVFGRGHDIFSGGVQQQPVVSPRQRDSLNFSDDDEDLSPSPDRFKPTQIGNQVFDLAAMGIFPDGEYDEEDQE
jgi:hypothetical protein